MNFFRQGHPRELTPAERKEAAVTSIVQEIRRLTQNDDGYHADGLELEFRFRCLPKMKRAIADGHFEDMSALLADQRIFMAFNAFTEKLREMRIKRVIAFVEEVRNTKL